MKLDKISDENKLDICKKYFYAGLAFLPFLWLINFVWFFKHAFLRSNFKEQSDIRKCKFSFII
jgi:presenilin enhancer 2